MNISEDTPLSELAKNDAIVRYLFKEWGLRCVGCILIGGETLKHGMSIHKHSKEDIDEAVEELNEILQRNRT